MSSIEDIKQKLSKTAKGSFAVFDFDNTCIVNDIGEAVLMYLARNKLFKDPNLLPEKFIDAESYSQAVFLHYHELLGEEKILEAYQFCTKILSGFTPKEVREITKIVLELEGKEIKKEELFGIKIARGLKVHDSVIELFKITESLGMTNWIVTASSQLVVEAAAEHFSIKAKVVGVQSVVREGVLTQEIETPAPIREGKVTAIQHFINKQKPPVLAVGDSMNDQWMLKYADIKVVVGDNEKLIGVAKERDWEIL